MPAESIAVHLIEAVISSTVKRLAELLINEATSLSKVTSEVEKMQWELRYMKRFLEDADSRQNQDGLIREWIADVRDVACDIEDAIELYVSEVNSSNITKLFHLNKHRTRIKTINERLQNICERRRNYCIQRSPEERTGSLRSLRRSFPTEEEDLVSMDEDVTQNLKDQLLKEGDQLSIVSIVGMGRLGKTTLAKKVYNDFDVKRHFDVYAWVYISQQYVVREVLTGILTQVRYEREPPEEEDKLIGLIKDELKQKKYLVVLDDIWNTRAWNAIKKAFPDGRRGSKLLFTTHSSKLASSAGLFCSAIEPPLLTDEESWELLQRKVFFSREVFSDNGSRSEFEKLGKEMARRCGGLPLAVVVLGGLLSTKTALSEWVQVHRDVLLQLNKLESQDQYAVEEVLDLSYQDLPFYLKSCFLYLGCFPEDSKISTKKLIRLWIAEGFVSTPTRRGTEETLMEEAAEQYLGELINRSMVQVDKKDHTGEGVKTCRLHDRMRDFCISKARNEDFFQIMEGHETNIATSSSGQCSTATLARRMVRHCGQQANWMDQVHRKLRSLLFFGNSTLPTSFLRNKNLKLLRVLKLVFFRSYKVKIPTEIGNLVLLRYLEIRCADISDLPHSIGNLRNLHTLDIRDCPCSVVLVFGGVISKLVRLRHLLLPDWHKISEDHWRIISAFRIDKLSSLETLKSIKAQYLIRYDVMQKLTNLRDLGIFFDSVEEVRLILQFLSSNLGRLRSLRMLIGDKFPSLIILSNCNTLYKLSLWGNLSRSHSLFLPTSLTKLELRRPLLNQDMLAVLERLDNLRILLYGFDRYISPSSRLHHGAIMSNMVFSSGGFPKLEILSLVWLEELEEWEVEENAMPNPKRLDVTEIPKLRMVPDGLRYVTTLQELNIHRMSRNFEDRLRVKDGVEGEDLHKVKHIPSISFSQTRDN